MRISDWISDVCSSDLGYRRGADHHVDAAQVLAQPALLLRALLVGERARIAALARGADAEVEEPRPQRFDLLPGLGAHIEAFHLRAEAPGEVGSASCREGVCQDV